MSHDTHHHDASHHAENKPRTALRSSFWFVLILVLLFVSAVNFVNVESKSEGHEGHETEEMHSGTPSEATEGKGGTDMRSNAERRQEEPTSGSSLQAAPTEKPADGKPHSADAVLPSDTAR